MSALLPGVSLLTALSCHAQLMQHNSLHFCFSVFVSFLPELWPTAGLSARQQSYTELHMI